MGRRSIESVNIGVDIGAACTVERLAVELSGSERNRA